MNKNSKQNAGSVLLVLILIMTVITLILMQRLKSGTFSYDVVMMRNRTRKFHWSTAALVNYGISWCKTHKNDVLNLPLGTEKEIVVKWPLSKESTVDGTLSIKRSQDGVQVTARLTNDNKNYSSQHCSLEITPFSMKIKSLQ